MKGARLLTSPVEEFFGRNGVAFRRERGKKGINLVFDCPMCGRAGKASVLASTWQWRCFVCDEKGNEHALKKAYGAIYDLPGPKGGASTWEEHRAQEFAKAMMTRAAQSSVERWRDALQNAQGASLARGYLEERGIKLETARAVGLGWTEKLNDKERTKKRGMRWRGNPNAKTVVPGWLAIPVFAKHTSEGPDWTSAALIKGRRVNFSGKGKYGRVRGGESILYSPGKLDPSKTLLIVGGELDAVCCWQAEWANVAAPTTGEKWSDLWSKQLEAFVDIVVVYDNDETGQKGAQEIATTLGSHRCRVGHWPEGINDANEALLRFGESFNQAFLQKIVDDAKTTSIDGMCRLGDLRAQILDSLDADSIHGWETGWRDLDELIGGWRAGELTVVTGDTSCGKTTFTAQAALFFARHHGPVLYAPIEMGVKKHARKWMTQYGGRTLDGLEREDAETIFDGLEQLPIFVFWRSEVAPEALANTILYAAKHCGVRFVVIDHLHWLVRHGTESVQQIEAYMQALARAAMQSGVHLLLVAHPHSIKAQGKHRDNTIVQLSDLKGASAIKQDADNGLSIWKPRDAERKSEEDSDGLSEGVIYSLKQRDDMGAEGAVHLRFDKGSARFLEPVRTAELFKLEGSVEHTKPNWSVTDRGARALR